MLIFKTITDYGLSFILSIFFAFKKYTYNNVIYNS